MLVEAEAQGTLGGLIDGAKAARQATNEAEGIDVEIVVTELGLIVRGTVDLQTCHGHASHELQWPEFWTYPAVLVTVVRRVEEDLRRRKDDWGQHG